MACMWALWREMESSVIDAEWHQDQDSLLVKRRNDSHSPGPVIKELVPTA